MLKLMVSRPGLLGLFAALIASRNVQLLLQTPSSVSAAEVTTKIAALARAATLKTQASWITLLNTWVSFSPCPGEAGREESQVLVETPNRLDASVGILK